MQAEVRMKDCLHCQLTQRFKRRCEPLTAYFLEPHVRSTTLILYRVMAAKRTSDEFV